MQNNNQKLKIFPPKAKHQNFSLFTFHFEFDTGFGLVEIIIVTAIILMAMAAFLQVETIAIRLMRAGRENVEAAFVSEEGIEGVRALRDESWANNIASLTNGTTYYLFIQNSKWALTTTAQPAINGAYTRRIVFDQVFRDAQDKISSSGTVDVNTKKVTVQVMWSGSTGNKEFDAVTYLTNFQNYLRSQNESKIIYFEGAATDGDFCGFPSPNTGGGDPAQSFTTGSQSLQITKIELLLRPATTSPSDFYAELRLTPTSAPLGTTGVISAATVATTSANWVELRFPTPVSLNSNTKYYIRVRSIPDSTIVGSGSRGPIDLVYQQGSTSQFPGGEVNCAIGKQSNQNDAGQAYGQYDFGFRIYTLQ